MENRERGGCLSLWLLINGFSSIWLVWFVLSGLNIGRVPLGIGIVGIIIGSVYLLATIGVWNWQRWGVYTLVGFSIVSNSLQVILGINPLTNTFTLVFHLAIYYFLIRPKWKLYE